MEKMNKRLGIVIAVILIFQVVTIAVMLGINSGLRNELASLRSTMHSVQNHVQSSVDSRMNELAADLNAKLEQQASLFADVSHKFGTPDADSATIPVTVTAMPKAVTPETRLFLTVGDRKVELERDDAIFSVHMDIDLFAKCGTPVFSLEEGECVYTELADFSLSSPYWSMSSALNVRFVGSNRYQSDMLTLKGKWDGVNMAANFVSLKIVVEKNGEIIESLPAQKTEAITADASYPMKEGDTLRFIAVAEDIYGFRQEVVMEEYTRGTRIEHAHYMAAPLKIYNAANVLVYETEGRKVDI